MNTLSKRVADLSADKLRALAERLKARDGAAGTPRIRPVPRGDEPLPLSFSQERLWFLDRLEEGASSYEIPAAVRFSGPLDPGVLARAFEELERRHESLRTTFGEHGGRPFQRIAPAGTNGFILPLIDLSAIPEPQREAELLRGAVTGQRFDLARGPLMRSRLFRFGPEEHALVLSLHHIIADGWSMEVLVREVTALYQALLQGRPSSLSPLPVQYADYAVWQRDQLRGELLAQELSFWRERLAGIEPLALPTDRPRPARPSFRGAQRTLEVPGDTAALLYEHTRRAGLTPFIILTAAWKALLARYTGQTDVAVGSPIANRRLAEVQGLIGFFANTVVLRTSLADDPEAGELLRCVREVVAGAFAHEELPFEKLVQELQPERDLGRNPLFQVMVSLQTRPLAGTESAGLRLLPMELPKATAKFDLTLSWQEEDGRLSAALEHSTDLFDGDTAGRMLAHLAVLLRGLVEDPARRLSELPLLTAAERRQLLVEWNETAAPYPRGLGLHELFEAQAERTPEAPALLWGEERVSYRDLDRQAGRLARRLVRLGVGPEDLVGIFARRTPAMVAGMLAVLKTGGAYLPLDPAYPPERLALLLADSEAPVVLAQPELAGLLPPFDGDLVLLGEVEEEGGDLPRGLCHPDQMAYAIYTSGSTGRPKGVVIRHAGAVARIAWAVAAYGPERLARTLAATSICFDLSVFEIFAPLAVGGAVVLADDALALPELPAAAEVTLVNTVPSAMAELARSGKVPPGVRTVNLAGEPLRRELADRLYDLPGIEEVWDLYGPSEDTTYSTGARVERGSDREPAIGKPLPNSRAYVLDARFEPSPVGVPGELWLGGDGLARGYLDRPDLTADRFRPDPYGRPGDRLYRTGDLARWLAAGELAFLGRIDHQVKVRGFRIELGEIEAALLRCPEVAEAVVVVREDTPGGGSLVTYVVAPDLANVRARLAQTLPAYMLPSAWVSLPALPLTPNGKVDRKALPAPDGATLRTQEPVAPRSDLERSLAEVWAEVLRRDVPGVHDNFFEIGGHSLLAMQVISQVRERLEVELPVRTLFEVPTVAGLSAVIAARLAERAEDAAPLDRIERRPDRHSPAPLSFSQQRLWFLDQLDLGSAAYNMPAAFRLQGGLDLGALQRAFAEIVRRHEVLRTTFATIDGEPRQVIAAPRETPLPVLDLAALPDLRRSSEALDLAAWEARRPFDLAAGPLLRLLLVRLGSAEHALLVTVHHIVSDGWSTGVLLRELVALYEAFATGRPSPLPELPVQYADFAVWQRQRLSEERLAAGVTWWRERLAGMPEHLDLPTDRPRPKVPSGRGGTVGVHLRAAVGAGVRRLAQQRGATPFMVLLAAFQTLLARYTGTPDVVTGAPVAGRDRAELEGLIGFFVNTLVLRTDLSGAPGFTQLVDRARDGVLQAFAHQEVPFERLVEEIQPDRQLGRMPLVQTLFNFVDRALPARSVTGLTVAPVALHGGTAKLELSLSLGEQEEGGLDGSLEYSADLFEPPTVRRLAAHLEVLLAGAVADPGRSIADLALLTGSERRQLLTEWNDTAAPDEPVCLHELFAARAALAPDAVAVDFAGHEGPESLTYGELNARANRLARYLRRMGVEPEVVVGLCLERSAELIVGLLGILKAGGTYLPLDPAYPNDRLLYVLEDSGARVLITSAGLLAGVTERADLPVSQPALLLWEAEEGAIARESRENPGTPVQVTGLAYVIYTSGSTGRPKGVLVSHRGIRNLSAEQARLFDLTPADRVLQFSSPSFDASVWEVLMALGSGARLCLAPQAELLPGPALLGRLRDGEVTAATLTPSTLAALPYAELPALRTLVVAGEACPVELADLWAVGRRLVNAYGPTEATVCATAETPYRPGAGRMTLGRPLANTEVHLLGRKLDLVPAGVAGEMLLGGVGLARGYLGRPDLTAERFVPHPFGRRPGERLYRTGDLARRLPDGRIEFLGRIDHQVKIRGFRVELGEIEAALYRHPAVSEAVAVLDGSAGDPRIVGYVVSRPDQDPSAQELRSFLARELPAYMVPAALLFLPALPLTPSGKLDRRALPVPDGSHREAGREVVPPRSPLEETLAEIWADVLNVEPVGIHDDFFALGGHSLKATQVIAQVRETLEIDLPVRSLFETPTVAGLAVAIVRQAAELTDDEDFMEVMQEVRGA